MIGPLIYFLIVCIVLVVVIYAGKLVIDMLALPPQARQLVLVIASLIALIVLLVAGARIFNVAI